MESINLEVWDATGNKRLQVEVPDDAALLVRDIGARGHVPTTAVTASMVAVLQVQETIELLHGQPTLRGEGIYVHGMWADFSRIAHRRREDCLGHDDGGPVHQLAVGTADTTLDALLRRAEDR